MPPSDPSPIQFNDGAGYEHMMGVWSRLAGDRFLDWLAAPPGARWLDVGCGNGAFTEGLVQRCAPAAVLGIDPAEPQLAYARTRPAARPAQFQLGDAMALPCADASFDAAVMALVLFFVPEPARGVAEMARAVRPGGLVAAYAWDMFGGGFPWESLLQALRGIGRDPALPPRADASRLPAMQALWEGAGLTQVQTCRIDVERTFENFDALWAAGQRGTNLAAAIGQLSAAEREQVQALLRAACPPDSQGRIRCRAWAHAVQGRTPAAPPPPATP